MAKPLPLMEGLQRPFLWYPQGHLDLSSRPPRGLNCMQGLEYMSDVSDT